MNPKKYAYYAKSIVNLLTRFENPGLILRIFLGSKLDPSALVRLKGSGLNFLVRGQMDIWSIKETFIDRFYERFGTPIEDGWTIVDIGAGLGDFTIYALNNYPANQVIACEPFDGSYTLLAKNLELNKIQGARIIRKAVMDKPGQVLLSHTQGEALQIITTGPSAAGISWDDQVHVPAITLQELLVENNLDRINLLKLDCEGAEYPILINSPADVFKRIDRIVMEYHEGAAGHGHEELVSHLSELGYKVTVTRNYVHDDLGYIYASRG